MATRMQQRRGTAQQWTDANPRLAAGEIGFETDTGKFKVGDDVNFWNDLAYFVNADDLNGELGDYATQEYVDTAIENVVGLAPETLDTLAELAASLGDDADFSTTIFNATEVSKQEAITLAEQYTDAEITTLSDTVSGTTSDIIATADALALDVQGLSSTLDNLSGDVTDVSNTVATHTTEIADLVTENTNQNTSIDTLNTSLTSKAPLENPTFTGTVVLPTTTSVGDVSSAELGHLNGVTSSIQDQIDAKLDSGVAAGTYAPLNDPTFGGTVVLPSTTSIGDVSATEIDYLVGVTSAIQTQIDSKAPSADPTFTGTVSGVTKAHVGLGNVDNTADVDKPVSSAQQTALDEKLGLSGGTMTGKITLDGDPTQALHAVTKQYVDSVEAGLITRPAVKAATTANLSGTYTNGTAGVDAQLNLGQLATLDIDGVTSWSQYNGILVKNQTNAFENGRYVVLQVGNDTDTDWILKRCPLCDEADEIPGSYIFVTDGAINEQTGWVQHVADPATFTVGTDDIDVYQFAGAGSVTAGTNVSVDGGQVSVVDAPAFSGTVDVSAAGVEFSDGIQTKMGVPSLTEFVEKTTSYTLDDLDLRDGIVEMNANNEAVTFTIPTNATLAWPVGASMDILGTGTQEVTIAGAEGVTINSTPGLKLRTQWSSATILKRAENSWIVYGDLKA
jgi:uncharacterized protein YoxC